ncbi:hypothetical protein [Amycolatopsis jejuensis]|uniref:hypothetical protein n=1 Tax=Amycolatopsis jejuensis TaxID=330084 RepID=UPI0005271C48|nr:hypothetical protein [Amycolatopsis jejuensis]
MIGVAPAGPALRGLLRFGAVAVAGTAAAVLFGPTGPLGGFWAPTPDIPAPSGAVLGGLVAERMIENLAFGAGLAILFTGRRWFGAAAHAGTAWLASVWLLASWMPHGALHVHHGMRPEGLLVIEWVFHVGVIAAVVALLWALPVRRRDM